MKNRAYKIGDYELITNFLSEVHKITGTQHSWLPARFEYAEYLCEPLFTERGLRSWKETFRIWEENGKIVGVILSENPNEEAFIQIHPEYRFLEEEMIEWAETHIALNSDDGTKKLCVAAFENDSFRQEILKRRGFKPHETVEYIKSQSLKCDIPQPQLPDGFKFSSMIDEERMQNRIESAVAAFEGTLFSLSVYKRLQEAPNYLKELDILIIDENDEIAAFCGVWYYPEDGFGVFEPVGTHPKHQRKGLGKAVVQEGLRQLKNRGASKAYVNAYAEHRSKFYASVGFEDDNVNRPWVKNFSLKR